MGSSRAKKLHKSKVKQKQLQNRDCGPRGNLKADGTKVIAFIYIDAFSTVYGRDGNCRRYLGLLQKFFVVMVYDKECNGTVFYMHICITSTIRVTVCLTSLEYTQNDLNCQIMEALRS